ncbi:queuine tRNA-ribosyltransferase accessory subunit 2 isoform X2 [Cephus cinctus]|nr:queuine tRNA-ribosyltransferase accessory subunit 2 isoform X2 [Cephus cinctus]XP_015604361.1 queuine tRNA-ribosyltransferase accessory subunit 2 isoform X2 [Cephus cinctus]XP_024945169.1 queuine tRNA-ribosyltransferase accessory subunit 2 isoform X2 [Cephus cinctus]
MKFFTESAARCAARIGTLSEIERMPDLIFETPLLLIYTKRGCVPHLTKDVLKMVTTEQQFLSVSLPSTITMAEFVKQTPSFTDFVSMQEYPTFLSINDPAETTTSGHQEKHSISIWAKHGRHILSPDSYMDIVETFKPDMYVALCDGDTDEKSSAKRISKSIERSKTQLETCLLRHNSSNTIKSKGILGAIEGGYNLHARERCINYLKDKTLLGYVIDGLHKNGPQVQKINTDQIRNVIEHTINLLPTDKLRVSMGSWNPATLVDLIDMGVDVFDSSYAYLATEKATALTFLCDHQPTDNHHTSYVISVAEDKYADDFTPICKSCECLACQKYTRAYLHHLCHCKELLLLVLLMIHNTHYYLQFFKTIRKHIKEGTFKEFQKKIHLIYDKKEES